MAAGFDGEHGAALSNIPDPYAWMPGAKKFLPITGTAGKHRKEKKRTTKINHIKKFGGRNASEASQKKNSGRPRDTRDVWADFCGKSNSRGRTSAGQTGHMTGQMGHVHGTDGTHTRGWPTKFFMLIGFCFPYCWCGHPRFSARTSRP